jgi:hypothetical protein
MARRPGARYRCVHGTRSQKGWHARASSCGAGVPRGYGSLPRACQSATVNQNCSRPALLRCCDRGSRAAWLGVAAYNKFTLPLNVYIAGGFNKVQTRPGGPAPKPKGSHTDGGRCQLTYCQSVHVMLSSVTRWRARPGWCNLLERACLEHKV